MADEGDKVGAYIENNYHTLYEEVCPVPKSVILDNTSSAKEEIWQYSFGGFLFSGAFWLGVERIVTEGYKDPLLWICVVCSFCGALLGITGYWQAKRRISRLEKYIP